MTGRSTQARGDGAAQRGPQRQPAAGARARIERAWNHGWDVLLRHRWPVLAGWAVVIAIIEVVRAWRWLGSWHYIVTGVQVLTGPHPFGLYATHPELQMGPITFVLSAPFVLLGSPLGLGGAALAMAAVGLLTLREIRRLIPTGDLFGERCWFLAGLVVVLTWNELAVRYGHPDDVLALFASVWGLRLLRSGSILRAALLFGLAIDCKPWVAPLAFVLLAAPRRRWLPAAAIVLVVVVAVWAPFLLDPGTLRAAKFTIAVDPTASIRLLGLAADRTPVWCRPAQMLIGAGFVAVLARRNRWSAALLAVVVVRLLLDPATHTYYEAGLVVAATVFDVRARFPVATLISLVGVHLPEAMHFLTTQQAVIRLVALILLLVVAVVVPPRPAADAGIGLGARSVVRRARGSGAGRGLLSGTA